MSSTKASNRVFLTFSGDGVDSNCDGRDDFDADGDGYSTHEGDCNDSRASVHPSASEVHGDGIDNYCDGSVDEGCPSTFYGGGCG